MRVQQNHHDMQVLEIHDMCDNHRYSDKQQGVRCSCDVHSILVGDILMNVLEPKHHPSVLAHINRVDNGIFDPKFDYHGYGYCAIRQKTKRKGKLKPLLLWMDCFSFFMP